MCGINGIFAYRDSAPLIEDAEILRVRDYMAKRGPDGAGAWISPDRRVGLGHRRLNIIDLSDAAAQPMSILAGRFRVTFNGEIYNYQALRKDLEQQGAVFRSQSDTEVLLHLYAKRGPEMVQYLRGMFAFAIWDEGEKTLFLARDPFGIKPLYFTDDGKTLKFASQVKALLAGGNVDTTPQAAGSVGFLLWGYVPEPYSLFRGIKAVPSGSSLLVKCGAVPRSTEYFSVGKELADSQETARPFALDGRDELAAQLRDTVQHHLVSDVPVGVFLSSGVDSTLVAALASEVSGARLNTLTLGFEEFKGASQDEAPIAEATAKELGTQHLTRWIKPHDFEAEYNTILDAMDQPTTDGVNTYLVCREAARAGMKVALSGLGGDELFGGYPSFRHVPRMVRWLGAVQHWPAFGRAVRRMLSPRIGAITSPKYAGLLEYGGNYEGAYLLRRALFMPWELEQLLEPDVVRKGMEELNVLTSLGDSVRGVRDPYAIVCGLELCWYMRNQLLRDADWAGMAHSIEIRVPFVDVALFRKIASWIVSRNPPLKANLATVTSTSTLKQALVRPKSGFNVPLAGWTGRHLHSKVSLRFANRAWAATVLRRQRSGKDIAGRKN